MVFYLLQVCPEGPKGDWGMKSKDPEEPWAEELTRTWEREDSTLVFTQVFRIKGWPTFFPTVEGSILSGSSKMTNCFWNFALFLFLVLGPTSVPSALSSSSAILTTSYLIFFSLPLPRNGSINCLYYPFLDWHTRRGTHNKVTPLSSLKKILCITYPTTPRSMLLHKSYPTTYYSRHNASSRKGQASVGGRGRENARIRNPSNLTRTNIVWEGILNSSLVTSKDSSLEVW